jgi:hypothetical protein
MRDPGEAPMGASAPVDRLLDEAGAHWRAGQPEPRAVTAALFEGDGGPRTRGTRGWSVWAFVAGAASAVALVVAISIAAPDLLPRFGGAGPGLAYISTGPPNCPLTKPEPPFEAPISARLSPDVAWYGTARLWVLLDRDGEDWTGLPHSKFGYTQKTFWWRDGYQASSEPIPPIFVMGRRLDGPGSFGFGPGTNASSELGASMLVGIDIPTVGCWELTGNYGTDTLSYVVWVGE